MPAINISNNHEISPAKCSGTMISDEFEDGTCGICGYEGNVYVDNGRCQDCDGNIVFCSVCKEEVNEEDTCRHVSRDDDFEWFGSGISDEPTPAAKKSFRALLDSLPKAFAKDLKRAIKAGKFHTWTVAPLIGGGGLLTLYGMPVRQSSKWGDRIIALGKSDRSDEFRDGYYWLASLYNDQTPGANAATLAMIDDRVAEGGPERAASHGRSDGGLDRKA